MCVRRLFCGLTMVLLVSGPGVSAQEQTAYERAFELYSEGRLQEAEEAYQRALREFPDSVGALVELGRVRIELGRANDALEPLRRAVEISPKMGVAHAELGAALLETGQWSEAIVSLGRAIGIDRRDVYSLVNLGRAYFERKEYQRAERVFEKALKVDAQFAAAWIELGRAQSVQGKETESIQSFRRAFEADPGWSEAFEEWLKAAEASGTERERSHVAAWVDYREDRMGKAEDGLRALIEQDGREARFWMLLGHVFLHQTPPRSEESSKAYQRALELDSRATTSRKLRRSSRSRLYEGLGLARFIADRKGDARRAFTSGNRLEPKYPGHLFHLAIVAAESKQRSSALKYLAKMKRLDLDGSWCDRAWEDPLLAPYRKLATFRRLFEPIEGK